MLCDAPYTSNPPNPLDFPTLRLEVFDYNQFTKGEFLGSCEIPPKSYFDAKRGDFALSPLPNTPLSKVKFCQGELSLSFWLQDNLGNLGKQKHRRGAYGTLEGVRWAEVHILGAKGLRGAKRLSGKSDPYVILKRRGKVVGETSVKRGTVNPEWANEFFLVNLSEEGYAVPDLEVEVSWLGLALSTCFLGCCAIAC